MPRQLRSRRGGFARERKFVTWAGFHNDASVTVAAATKVILGSFTPGGGASETLMRSYLSGNFFPDVQSGTQFAVGAIGLVVVSNDAFAIGATAVPGPVTDPGANWLLHGFFGTSIVAGFQPPGWFDFQSKAMRIVKAFETVAVVVENGDAVDGVDVQTLVRVLARTG